MGVATEIVLLVLFVFGVVDSSLNSVGKNISVLHDAVGLTVTSKCERGYFNIRSKRSFYFKADKKATRKQHFIGNDSQLQCIDREACSSSGYLREAWCYNYRSEDHEPEWECYAYLRDSSYRPYNMMVNCEKSSTISYCVLEDSCILLYSTYKQFPLYIFFLLSIAAIFCLYVASRVWLLARSRRRWNAASDLPSNMPESDYNAAADVPPSYNTVERNPQRFEKPRRSVSIAAEAVERQESEEPPPSYDTVSGES